MSEPKILIPPPCEPLSLADAKAQLRLDSDLTGDDTLVAQAITAARVHVENITRRQLVMTTLRLVLDGFPGGGGLGALAGGMAAIAGGGGGTAGYRNGIGAGGIYDNARLDDPAIRIFGGPLQAVISIDYADADGNDQTLDALRYLADTASDPARIMPAAGDIFGGVGGWPDTQAQVNTVEVTYTAGYMVPFTVNASLDTFTLADNAGGLETGQAVRLTAIDGTLPTGLAERTNYYVLPAGNQFSATPGGSAIDITNTGSGTLLIDAMPESFRQAIKIAMTFFYENRGNADAVPPAAIGLITGPEKVWRF